MINWFRRSSFICGILLLFLGACSQAAPAGTDTPTAQPPTSHPEDQTTADTIETNTRPEETENEAAAPVEIALATASIKAPPTSPVATETPLPSPTAVPPSKTPAPCRITGRVLDDSFPSTVAFGDYNYRIYLPPCYGLDRRVYPTLYLFGGNTHDESYWDEAGLDELAEEAITAGEMPPFLMVMPDNGWVANTTSGGPGSYEGLVMVDLIPFIEQNYCAWDEPAGRAIGGLSRGGYWSLEIAFRHPEEFARVGGHSAALIDSFAGPEVNPQFTALNNDLGDLAIYLDIGDEDWLLPNTLQLHEDMAAADIPHEWRLNPGAHEDSYWPAHFAEYLEWYTASWSQDRESYPTCDY